LIGGIHDQNIGISIYWFPASLSNDSPVIHQGVQLSAVNSTRPFVVSGIGVGQAFLPKTAESFSVSSDYLGIRVGVGADYPLNTTFSLSSSINYYNNSGLSQVAYDGEQIAITVALVFRR
jgi:hypothetical protein